MSGKVFNEGMTNTETHTHQANRKAYVEALANTIAAREAATTDSERAFWAGKVRFLQGMVK